MTTEAAQTNTSAIAACWSCRAPNSGAHFCAVCGKIQPLAAGSDYFAFLGLPRKLDLDPGELEKRFHSLSWKLHPDNFVRAADYERALSLELSSQLNDAFRALSEPVSRVEYLLALAGARKEGQQKQQAPPELLEEVFDLNESLDELREARQGVGDQDCIAVIGKALQTARGTFEEKLSELDAELQNLFGEWDRAVDSGAREAAQSKLLARFNDILNRRSYIRNLVQSVQKELADN